MSIGGFSYGSITEDFLTSMNLHSHGFQSKYVHEYLASGLSPVTLHDFYKQRLRWAAGGLQIFFRNNPLFKSGLSASQRFLYFFSGFNTFLSVPMIFLIYYPIICLMTMGSFQIAVFDTYEYFIAFLPYAVLQVICMKISYRGLSFMTMVRSFQESVFMIFCYARAVFSVMLGMKLSFRVTNKDTENVFRKSLNWVVPFLVYYLFASISIGSGVLQMFKAFTAASIDPADIIAISVSIFWTALIMWQMSAPFAFLNHSRKSNVGQVELELPVFDMEAAPVAVSEPSVPRVIAKPVFEPVVIEPTPQQIAKRKYLGLFVEALMTQPGLMTRLLNDKLDEDDDSFIAGTLITLDMEFNNQWVPKAISKKDMTTRQQSLAIVLDAIMEGEVSLLYLAKQTDAKALGGVMTTASQQPRGRGIVDAMTKVLSRTDWGPAFMRALVGTNALRGGFLYNVSQTFTSFKRGNSRIGFDAPTLAPSVNKASPGPMVPYIPRPSSIDNKDALSMSSTFHSRKSVQEVNQMLTFVLQWLREEGHSVQVTVNPSTSKSFSSEIIVDGITPLNEKFITSELLHCVDGVVSEESTPFEIVQAQ